VPDGRCSTERPVLEVSEGRGSACHLTAEQKQDLFADFAGTRHN
jgi:peptide/nickel transport system ATP-binding protein